MIEIMRPWYSDDAYELGIYKNTYELGSVDKLSSSPKLTWMTEPRFGPKSLFTYFLLPRPCNHLNDQNTSLKCLWLISFPQGLNHLIFTILL